jgi:hypothetical protein
MLLSELFDRLALGELSQHKFGKSGAILEDDRPAIINQIIIQQYETLTEYPLDIKYAVSNTGSTEPIKYILDGDQPFLDDVVRIEAAYNSAGIQIPLNAEHADYSWFTPTWDSIQIPAPVTGNLAAIVYRANHTKIAADAPLDTVIFIPPVLEEALQAYVAARCFVSLGNQSSAALSSYYTTRYEQQIQRVERSNLLQSSTGDNNIKLSQKGFI